MKLQQSSQISRLNPRWFKQIPKDEIKAEEDYLQLLDPTCSEWVGLKALYSLATRELKYHCNIEQSDSLSSIDLEPIITSNSIKSKLISIAISKADLLTFNEIRILNMLVDKDRKHVAQSLGIKKSRLSQIIKEIKSKLT
jgi:hypothetical protein